MHYHKICTPFWTSLSDHDWYILDSGINNIKTKNSTNANDAINAKWMRTNEYNANNENNANNWEWIIKCTQKLGYIKTKLQLLSLIISIKRTLHIYKFELSNLTFRMHILAISKFYFECSSINNHFLILN